MWLSLFVIALHVLSATLNIYVLAVISCGTDHQLQTLKSLSDLCIFVQLSDILKVVQYSQQQVNNSQS